jgi:RNA polymerase sigma-54 factor
VRFDASQSMRMSQGMKLAPHMIQSMEILQMSMAELEERIEQELENNPTLEIAEPEASIETPSNSGESSTPGDDDGSPSDGSASDSDEFDNNDFDDMNTSAEGDSTSEEIPLSLGDTSGKDDFERLEDFSSEQPDAVERDGDESQFSDEFDRSTSDDDAYISSSSSDDDAPSKAGAMANTAGKGQSVQEQLLEQWSLSDVKPAYRQIGEYLIGYIEDDGYFRAPMEDVLRQAPPALKGLTGAALTLTDLTEALQALQLILDPPGIAARDLRECLLLQIDAKLASADDGQDLEAAEHREAWLLARTLLDKHLDDLTNNRLPRIAGKLNVTVEQLKPAVLRLRTLRLAPGKTLAPTSNPGIVPDCIVKYDLDRDRYIAYLNDRRLPNLRLNEEYATISKDRTADKKTREFLKTNIGNAQFLIDAIQQRKRTLLRVLEAVVEQQREFFDYGPQAIKPLPMTKVAEQLGIHVATVSRAVAEKYVQTPRGVFPLRKFFTSGTTTESGEEVSWEAIKNAMTQLIETEDKRKPLSDDALADALKAQGFDIARRTVAKYRDQLGIPTGRLRKVHS